VAKPAGVQIKNWFSLMVGLLIAVNLAALIGSLIVSRSVGRVGSEAVPLANLTARMRFKILEAQRDMYQYLAEFSDSTKPALEHLEELSRLVDEVRLIDYSSGVAAELREIEDSAERYRKVLELMPSSNEGSRDWTRLREYSATAVEQGNEAARRAQRLAESAQAEIRDSNSASYKISTAAMLTSICVLIASCLITFALLRWWKKLQDIFFEMS